MGNAALVKFLILNSPTVLGALFSGPSESPYPQLRKLLFYAAFHNSNRYSTPFNLFSVWSEQGDITPWDNKSTRGQEVRLTPHDLWPYEISLSHMSVAMPHPSRGPEESSTAKNNITNRHRSDPNIHLSCSVSHPGSSQAFRKPLPGLPLLSVTAANVLLRLLQIWAEVRAYFEGKGGGGVQGAAKRGQRKADLGGCLCRSYYWGLFPQTGREFLARNWKDFSGALGFGPPRQNVRHGGQLHHRATVRARGGLLFQNNSDVIYKLQKSLVLCFRYF